MNYEQALAYLDSLGVFGSRPGLERIQGLLERMGRPERNYLTIHVTGTNGKGSTTAFCAAVLTAAGVRTGMYTSPHLTDYRERMIVDGVLISPDEFGHAVGHARELADRMVAEGFDQPTEFEVLTAAAFYHFAEAKVEYAVIEVGLGGLLDSTNVITPAAAVITNVALEHTDRCGSTLAEIAVHKAGIIKPRVPVVTAARGEALNIIYDRSEELNAPLFVLDRDFFVQSRGEKNMRQYLTVRTNQYGNVTGLATRLLGLHQGENCALAVMTAKLLAQKDGRLTDDAIRRGVENACWPARFELLGAAPDIVVDAAHNPAGARALKQALTNRYGDSPVVFLFGVLADKDVTGMIDALITDRDAVVTVAPLSERAMAAADLAMLIRAERVEDAPTVADGLTKAVEWAGPTGIVCVCGSLYMIGVARSLLTNGQNNAPPL